jgi:S1-C subfamily serine protease
MTRYWRISVFIACLLLTQTPSRADTIPEIVKRAKPAVVEIVALDEKGSPTKLGTGFFISADGLVVTNCHVIQGASSLAAFDNHGALFGLERILACSTDPDLAILGY